MPHSKDINRSVFSCKNVTVSALNLSFCMTNAVVLSNAFRGNLVALIDKVSFISESLPTPCILMVSVNGCIVTNCLVSSIIG